MVDEEVIRMAHLYAFLIVIWHDSDALMSDTDVGGDAILNHWISSLNNLENKSDMNLHSCHPAGPAYDGDEENKYKSLHSNDSSSSSKFFFSLKFFNQLNFYFSLF